MTEIDWKGETCQASLDAIVHGNIFTLMESADASAGVVRGLLS